MTAERERVSPFLEGTGRTYREIISPEGVPLPVELADYGERAVAFTLDLFLQSIATMVIFVVVVLVPFGNMGGLVARTVALFIAFFVRNFYFTCFELAWQGATPGKRIVGLRVIDRRGGPLLPAAVIARNLTREIETFLPLGILQSPMGEGADVWETLSLAAWMLLFALLPFFNRDCMRAGDLIAGTMVIALPRRMLLSDLVEKAFNHIFSDKQLNAYGTFELQVLEELLRRPPGPESTRLCREVCDKIRQKIEWAAPVPDSDTDLFLRDFYTAERAYLEREQLFGRAHADKHYRSKAAG